MGLFGNLFKGKKKGQNDLSELKKDKRFYPLLNLIMVMREGDRGEIAAALAKPMKCWKCDHEFPVGQFMKQMQDKEGWFMVKCPDPHCSAKPMFFGPKS